MLSGHLRHYIDHYFAPHPSQQVRGLFLSRAILDFAAGSVMLFEPIYLHSIGFSIPTILLFWAALYVVYFFLLPLGGRICRRHGYEHTILFSSPFLILYYLSFFAIPYNKIFIIVALLSLAIQKILYWPGYHSNFVTWGEKGEQGREVSNMAVIVGIATVLAPAFGGFLIAAAGFRTLFVVVSVLIVVSNIPLLKIPELYVPQEFSYRAAMGRLVQKENRRKLFTFLGYGEELIMLVMWPLFLAVIIPNFTSLGVIISLAMVANIIVTLYVGRLSDETNKVMIVKSGVFYTSASWIARLLVNGGLGVFLIDSFYRVSKNMVEVPLISMIYNDARKTQVMESVVFFEMALCLGKIFAALLCAVLFLIFPGSWTPIFILAGMFTIFYSFMSEKKNDTI